MEGERRCSGFDIGGTGDNVAVFAGWAWFTRALRGCVLEESGRARLCTCRSLRTLGAEPAFDRLAGSKDVVAVVPAVNHVNGWSAVDHVNACSVLERRRRLTLRGRCHKLLFLCCSGNNLRDRAPARSSPVGNDGRPDMTDLALLG